MKKIFFLTDILFLFAAAFTGCSGDNDKTKTEQLVKDETYTCTMHNEVMGDHRANVLSAA